MNDLELSRICSRCVSPLADQRSSSTLTEKRNFPRKAGVPALLVRWFPFSVLILAMATSVTMVLVEFSNSANYSLSNLKPTNVLISLVPFSEEFSEFQVVSLGSLPTGGHLWWFLRITSNKDNVPAIVCSEGKNRRGWASLKLLNIFLRLRILLGLLGSIAALSFCFCFFLLTKPPSLTTSFDDILFWRWYGKLFFSHCQPRTVLQPPLMRRRGL